MSCEYWGCLHILPISAWNAIRCQAVANSVTLPLNSEQWPECNDRWHMGSVDGVHDRTQTPSVTLPYFFCKKEACRTALICGSTRSTLHLKKVIFLI